MSRSGPLLPLLLRHDVGSRIAVFLDVRDLSRLLQVSRTVRAAIGAPLIEQVWRQHAVRAGVVFSDVTMLPLFNECATLRPHSTPCPFAPACRGGWSAATNEGCSGCQVLHELRGAWRTQLCRLAASSTTTTTTAFPSTDTNVAAATARRCASATWTSYARARVDHELAFKREMRTAALHHDGKFSRALLQIPAGGINLADWVELLKKLGIDPSTVVVQRGSEGSATILSNYLDEKSHKFYKATRKLRKFAESVTVMPLRYRLEVEDSHGSCSRDIAIAFYSASAPHPVLLRVHGSEKYYCFEADRSPNIDLEIQLFVESRSQGPCVMTVSHLGTMYSELQNPLPAPLLEAFCSALGLQCNYRQWWHHDLHCDGSPTTEPAAAPSSGYNLQLHGASFPRELTHCLCAGYQLLYRSLCLMLSCETPSAFYLSICPSCGLHLLPCVRCRF